MRDLPLNVGAALSIAFAAATPAPASTSSAFALGSPTFVKKQIRLTDIQIENVINSQKELGAATDKINSSLDAKRDFKVFAQLDDIVKRYGFANFDDYSLVIDNIALVMEGFDTETKKYVGAETVIRQRIAAVKADRKIPTKEKKNLLADLDQSFKDSVPPVQIMSNIDLIAKYYDQLIATMKDDN